MDCQNRSVPGRSHGGRPGPWSSLSSLAEQVWPEWRQSNRATEQQSNRATERCAGHAVLMARFGVTGI
ncbi:hypothetical protein EYF80_018346 [Liparis tanakae]|uniref:Uncharacterized protein n=1 Tax=Liparis tanakae TaxID=230148 RepID=A0A4Z2I0A9_9TELE|nr:hypothetical protein EYF80_018346 [Liparis tanakae]